MRWELATTAWALAALGLIAAEVIAPGAFMLWLGIAAAATCLIVFALPELPVIAQMLVFAVLSVASVLAYRHWFRGAGRSSDQPALNRRAEQLIGRVEPLVAPIVDGRGRVQIADALWDVEGPDLPVGTRVRIVGVRGMTLEVRPQ
ncbi:membrane protein [Lysobacter xinjiangensis]|uniref:Membrane protein n=1 Tax=Cognatilysobacter xinjiangensis TaxID=546892 RepID=A0ABQ3BPL8_9GAMM|nr:NfeD family protein [Lysobacter xinjiangensis]GGZ53372.1 membrane protein [Lysobacter xinjiangensis]